MDISGRSIIRVVCAGVCVLASCSRPARRESSHFGEVRAERERPAPRFHDFRPSVNGFHFRNGFQGQVVGTGESAYGLCGGMSFAAADYFLAGRPIPTDVRAPADGSPLFKYIYARQAASFGALGAMGLKYVEWMRLPDDAPAGEASTHARTLAELPHITAKLSRGEPVVLGLVLTSVAQGGKAWDNHQVLALSAAEPSPGRTDIRIYDSNFPDRDDIVISVSREPMEIRQVIPGRGYIPIRGLFRMAYVPATPPG